MYSLLQFVHFHSHLIEKCDHKNIPRLRLPSTEGLQQEFYEENFKCKHFRSEWISLVSIRNQRVKHQILGILTPEGNFVKEKRGPNSGHFDK